VKDADEQFEALTREIESMTAHRELLEQEQTQLRADERALTETREVLMQEQVRIEGNRERIVSDRDTVISSLWEQYELSVSEAQAQRIQLDSVSAAQHRITELQKAMRQMGDVNVGAIEEYAEVRERCEFYAEQIKDLEVAKTELDGIISDLTRQMKSIFVEQLGIINERFGQVFRKLFGGGTAMLTIEDPHDVLESGIDIRVQPEGKVVNLISTLSGGEQALSAIALYFAILEVRPSPFVILDEIDTALDETNVVRLANYIRWLKGKFQVIMVTHRRGSMEVCDVLYGVTMQERGVSKLLRIDVNDMESRARLGAK